MGVVRELRPNCAPTNCARARACLCCGLSKTTLMLWVRAVSTRSFFGGSGGWPGCGGVGSASSDAT